MRIFIPLDLTNEQIDALKAMAAERNAKRSTKWTWEDLATTWARLGLEDRIEQESKVRQC